MTDDSEVIVAEGVGRKFGRTRALRNIDLVVPRGQITGLIGADGSGKTTLLQILAAILDPSEGTCRTLGYDTVRQSSSVTGRIGYMAQGFTLYERLTVRENLRFAAKVRNVRAREFAERSARLLEMANLGDFLDRREGALSGGMRKKLALCANLIHEPPLLLLDEPGLGVDPISRRDLWRVLGSYRDRGSTIIVSTSYMDEAQRCDRVVFLDSGRILADGDPGELSNRANGFVTLVASDNPVEMERFLARDPDVLAVEWRSGELYAVTRSPSAVKSRLQERQSGSVTLKAAKPELQDAFLLLRSAPDFGGTALSEESRPPVSDAPVKGAAGKASKKHGIVTQGLTKRFGDFVAVDDISLKVSRGEIFGLLGANGAGKTTLIRMLCGLLAASGGQAEIAGVELGVSNYGLRQRIGYVSQRFSLYYDLTVRENLRFFASAYGLDRAATRQGTKWAADLTDLAGAEDDMVANLSAAVRQRVALACAILHDPSVLFLDEPTSGVDPTARTRFWHLIRLLAQRGTTILVTTHYMDEAAYCDRLGFMDRGRMVAVGNLRSLRDGLPADTPDNPEDIFLGYMQKERIKRGDSPERAQ